MQHVSRAGGRWPVVFSALLITLGAEYAAAQPTTIDQLVACLGNNKPADVSQAPSCLPQGCKLTVTMSPFSAQPACNLQSTQLPRVILNCPGASAGLRFRPSFSLCTVTAGGDPNATRIEVGQDIPTVAANGPGNMRMANIAVPMAAYNLLGADGVLSTKGNDKKCNDCHSDAKPDPVNDDDPILSVPFDSYGAQVLSTNLLPYIIHTTEPNKKALVASLPNPRLKNNTFGPNIKVNDKSVQAQALNGANGICTAITNTVGRLGADAYDVNGVSAPLQALCEALGNYEAFQSCGNNGPAVGLGCHGIVGGGLVRNNGVLSSVSLDFSGQTTQSGNTLTYDQNKIDATMLAFNYADPPGTQVNTLVLQTLVVTGPGNGNSATATGTATIQVGVNPPTLNVPIMVTISVMNGSSSIMITSLDGKTTYAGGSAVGTLFLFN